MNIAIILAGGSGNRFGAKIPKQYTKIGNKKIIQYTINSFESSKLIDKIIIVVDKKYLDSVKEENKQHTVISGGETRTKSSYCGLLACPGNSKKILIHDAARPFVSQRIISSCIESLDNYKAVATSIPATDTIIKAQNNEVINIENRNHIFLNQTPQGFDYNTILKAHKCNKSNSTDDISLLNLNEIKCKIIEGSKKNIKITTSEDIHLAKGMLNL